MQYPIAASTPNTKGKIPLHYAAREGRKDMVGFFLHVSPHTARITSKKKKLALHFAAGDGHTDVVRQLLRVYPEGASLPSAKGKLPIHFAARWGHMDIASDLLFVFPQGVRCLDWDGSLPLHDAAREGQVTMSKFLIERYPVGLTIANIRGEIPLFPAVRSGNVDLVTLYLQGWALGGMHILKAVSQDDNIHSWDWNIVELCLRGAVENFSGCALLEGKEPPDVCCSVEGEDCFRGFEFQTKSSTPTVMKACCRYRQVTEGLNFSGRVRDFDSVIFSDAPASVPVRTDTSGKGEPTQRSKSPILEQGGSRAKKRFASGSFCNERKRTKCGNADGSQSSAMGRPRVFIALHAALACGASSHVIKCVLKKHPKQVMETDELGRLPLHFAVGHPACTTTNENKMAGTKREGTDESNNEDVVKIIVDDILKAYPEAAFALDCRGQLPLHLAIAAKAEFSIIQALLEANPSSGVDPIQAGDPRFLNKPPIYMATAHDCDLNTTFVLLRGDPSVVASTVKQ